MDPETILPLKETLDSLPPEVPSTDLASIITQHQKSASLPILVVLDDDPTGTHTCHDINVLTVWDQETLLDEFRSTDSGFFILTNSRALHTPEARDLIREICIAVKSAAEAAGKAFEVVLRGDSTLRGHFPDEPEIAQEVLGDVDGWILAPYFRQGGRLTINDVHYVADYPNNKLVPAAQTPFAKDASFGYENSDLKKYVVEKAKGRVREERVFGINLDDIRTGGPQAVAEKLLGLPKGAVVVVNSVVDTDMEVVMLGILEAETHGKHYLYRTGAAFVSTRLAIPAIPPLTPSDLSIPVALITTPPAPGGLIVAGSHVPKTTAQLASLTNSLAPTLHVITLDVATLLQQSPPPPDSSNSSAAIISAAISAATASLRAGHDVLVQTSRGLVRGPDEASSLRVAAAVAAALVTFLRGMPAAPRPRYVVAKGGITSSDMASKALGMRRARVVGQAAPGVPLWRCREPVTAAAAGSSSKWPGVPFVVFPGNVGDEDALRDLVAAWAPRGWYK